MKPRTQGIADPQSAPLLDQNEKCGLKGILRVMRVGQNAPAHPQNHRPVSLDQDRES